LNNNNNNNNRAGDDDDDASNSMYLENEEEGVLGERAGGSTKRSHADDGSEVDSFKEEGRGSKRQRKQDLDNNNTEDDSSCISINEKEDGDNLVDDIEQVSNSSASFANKIEEVANDKSETEVRYTIKMSKDYGPAEDILVVQIFAQENFPCPDGAVPMHPSDGSDPDAHKDQYHVYIDPEQMMQFLFWTGIRFDEELSALFFLLTFPYFEHEWDIVDYVEAVVHDDDDDDDDEEGTEDEGDGQIIFDEEHGIVDGPSSSLGLSPYINVNTNHHQTDFVDMTDYSNSDVE